MDRLAPGLADRELVEGLARLTIMRLRFGQESGVALLRDLRQQRRERAGDVADEAEIEPGAAAEVLAAQIDLRDLGLGRVELPIGEIRAQHQQQVAVEHRVVAGREADQAGHADVERIVVLDIFLAAQGVDDRRLERVGQREHLHRARRRSRRRREASPAARR